MSVLDRLFGGKPQQAPQQAQQQGQQQASAGMPGTDPNNPTVPQGDVPATQQAAATEQHPLDAMKDIWQQPQVDPTAQAPKSVLDVDPKMLMQSAGKLDFAKMIKPETMQAISAGGEGAVTAFAQAMNQIGQATYAQSLVSASRLVKEALNEHGSTLDTRISDTMRRNLASERLTDDRPELRHPAAQPLISAIQQQLAAKHPNASASELRQLSEDYLMNFAGLFGEKKGAKADAAKADTSGMEDFFADLDLN